MLPHPADAPAWLPIADFAVSVFGLFILAVTVWYAHKAWKESRRSADLAERALADARQSDERQVRAYLATTHLTLSQLAVGQPIKVEVRIANLGQTPAQVEHVWCGVGSGHYPSYDFQNGEPNPIWSKFTLGKDCEYFSSGESGAVLSEPAHQAIIAGTHAAYCWGEAVYRDVFGQRHITRWRVFAGGTFGIKGTAMCPYHTGNEAD